MALAIFDLDNTLLRGDSDHSWGQFMVTQGLVDKALYSAMNDKFLADYKAEQLNISEYLTFSLAPLTTLSSIELHHLHALFMQDVIEPLKQPKATKLIEAHRKAGDRLLVITATNRFIIEPIVRSLLIEEFLATEPELINGCITGDIIGTPTYREGKVERLNVWLQEHNESLAGSYFYSDSINDLPLLQEVDNPIAVDPDDRLRQEAQQQGWEIISLRS